MKNHKLNNSIFGFLLTLSLGFATFPAAYADDIDIYTQRDSSTPVNDAKPLVILTLDLNLDVTDILCSDVLADPDTLTGSLIDNTACALIQQLAVIPVLADITSLNIGSLLNRLLGEGSALGGILGILGPGVGAGLSELTNVLEPIVGSDSIVGNIVSTTGLDVIRLLLYSILKQLVGVNLGIMVSHANTCATEDFAVPRRDTVGCSNGGYFLLEPIELLDNNINEIIDEVLVRLDNFQLNVVNEGGNVDATPPFQGKEVYYELYRYFTGGDVYNAPLGANDLLFAPGSEALGDTYDSPLDSGICQDIHIINVLLTNPDSEPGTPPEEDVNDESDTDILADPGLPGIDHDGDGNLTFADMVNHFAEVGINYDNVNYKVKSQFLVNGTGGGSGGVFGLLGNATSTLGNLPVGLNPIGLPFVTKENFLPVNVASASFGGPQPVFSGGDRTQSGDNLYLGMFKPNANRKPAWRGNLKKLRLAPINGELNTVDALGARAIGQDGNLRPQALTFWTDVASLPPVAEGEVAGRDGKATDLGGAGSFLIAPRTEPTEENNANALGTGSDQGSPAGPRVFYQTASAAGQLNIAPLDLNEDAVTDADLVMEGDEVDAAALIAFARGYDVPDNYRENQGFLSFLEGLTDFLGGLIFGLLDVIGNILQCLLNPSSCQPNPVDPGPRDWLMGDVLHSHPLAIDYGNDDIRIFTGTNLGFMHQFRDAPLASEASTFGGQEVWRVAPRATLANFDEWHSSAQTTPEHPYGVDGAPVAWVKDSDGTINDADGDHVKLYFGLRRGGKGYYALDATNPDDAPTGMWNINKTSGGGDFDEMGLTFSTPQIGRIRTLDTNGNAVFQTVLVFGGGYNGGFNSSDVALGKDATKGNENVVGTNDTEGNAIFIVNADTGALIWKARKGNSASSTTTTSGSAVWEHPDFEDGIASDITALDTTGDGLLNRLYVGDTGGRIWRADIGSGDISEWKAAPIANLGRHATSTVAEDRRFFERPDVIRVSKGGTGFFTLVIGSGNRADPLNRNTENQLFVIKDSGLLDTTASATPTTVATLQPFKDNCGPNQTCLSLLNPAQVANGWYIPLGPAGDIERRGEKALSSPVTVGGQVLFTSYIPPAIDVNVCKPQEGTGRLYAVDLLTGKGVLDLFAQDGEPTNDLDYARGTPMASAGIPSGVRYIRPETFLGSDFSLTNVSHQTTWRTYWRESDGER